MPAKRKKTKKQTKSRSSTRASKQASTKKPSCGLCGKTKGLTKSKCCDHWICDDAHTYQMFSYARNSCYRNHHRYTVCASHHNEDHEGRWQDCQQCREAWETEMYVWYATNEFNFEKLENPPDYEPTRCAQCNQVIRLGQEGYSRNSKGYRCERCTAKELGSMFDQDR